MRSRNPDRRQNVAGRMVGRAMNTRIAVLDVQRRSVRRQVIIDGLVFLSQGTAASFADCWLVASASSACTLRISGGFGVINERFGFRLRFP